MIGKFRDIIQELPEYTNYVLAVSGGIDSMVMLDLFNISIDKERFKVVHIDHQLRDKSPLDWELIKEYCVKNNIVHHLEQVNVGNGPNIQARARDMRYAALNKYMEDKDTYIVTAHHKGDQVETVLLNLLRGTNIKGLSGIRKVEGNKLRPLLDWTRRDVLRYKCKNDVPHIEDESNASDKYLRNQVRHEVVPMLESVRPGIQKTIPRLVEGLQDDVDYMESISQNAFHKCARSVRSHKIVLDNELFRKEHRAIKFRVVQIALKTMTGKHANSDAIRQFIDGNKSVSLRDGGCLWYDKDGANIAKDSKELRELHGHRVSMMKYGKF